MLDRSLAGGVRAWASADHSRVVGVGDGDFEKLAQGIRGCKVDVRTSSIWPAINTIHHNVARQHKLKEVARCRLREDTDGVSPSLATYGMSHSDESSR